MDWDPPQPNGAARNSSLAALKLIGTRLSQNVAARSRNLTALKRVRGFGLAGSGHAFFSLWILSLHQRVPLSPSTTFEMESHELTHKWDWKTRRPKGMQA